VRSILRPVLGYLCYEATPNGLGKDAPGTSGLGKLRTRLVLEVGGKPDTHQSRIGIQLTSLRSALDFLTDGNCALLALNLPLVCFFAVVTFMRNKRARVLFGP
jgi:hypothetical protein